MNETDPFFESDAETVELPIRNEFREAAREQLEKFRNRGLRLVFGYDGNKLLALYAWAHAIGEYEMTGCKTAVDIARVLFGNPKKKAAVTKCIRMFQDCLNLDEGMPGQRSLTGRLKMAEARRAQLKTKKEK